MAKKFFILIFSLCSFLCTGLSAESSYKLDFSSSYIWRGFDLNPTQKPVLQPSMNYIFGDSGFSLNLWGSISFADKELMETDLTLTYKFKTSDDFSLSAGLIHYGWYFVDNFRFKDDTSHEIFASVDLPLILFNPTLTVYYDFTNGDGFYTQLNADYSYQFHESIRADLTASLGYNGGQWLAEGADSGFSDLNLGMDIHYTSGQFIITPFVRYTFGLLSALGKEDYFWFGVSLSIE